MKHNLKRTSDKGTAFLGECTRCGATDVTTDQFRREECPVTPTREAYEDEVFNLISGN